MTAWRQLADADQVAGALLELYEQRGHASYDEAMSQTSHAIQCAELARAAGAPDALVAAALLHDVGHLLEPARQATRERDRKHEELGARFLAGWYAPDVTEPIRHHVAAKRYLCAIDADYHATLSPASVRSLELQGGPMSAAEVAAFEASPRFAGAAGLRRWDDLAKQLDVDLPPLRSYRSLLADLARL